MRRIQHQQHRDAARLRMLSGCWHPWERWLRWDLGDKSRGLPECRAMRRAMGDAERWKGLGWRLPGGIRWDVLLPVRFWDEEPSNWSPGRGWKRKGDLEPSPCHPRDPRGPQCGREKEQRGLWVGGGGSLQGPPRSAPRFSPPGRSRGGPSPLGVTWRPPRWSPWRGDTPLSPDWRSWGTPLHPTAQPCLHA